MTALQCLPLLGYSEILTPSYASVYQTHAYQMLLVCVAKNPVKYL